MSGFPKCLESSCAEPAVSFFDRCWQHAPKEEYLPRLRQAVSKLSFQTRLNLKKVECSHLDFTNADLRDSIFTQARFSNSNFIGADLKNSNFIGARLDSCNFVGCDMAGAYLTRAALNDCSLSHSNLKDAFLDEARLHRVDFMGATLCGALIWNADFSGARHLKKRSFNADPNAESGARLSEKDYAVARDSYRALKRCFYQEGLPEDASWAAYKELTMERKHFLKARDWRYAPSLLMDILSGYTEKPDRVILSSLGIIMLFACFYFFLSVPTVLGVTESPPATFLESLYFSFITFTTVGYGDFVPRPVGFFRLMTCIEAFSGPFMAGLYVFTLTRRYSIS